MSTKRSNRDVNSIYYTNKTIRSKVDRLLEANAKLECTLGTDSSVSEYKNVKRRQKQNIAEIKNLDLDFYKSIVLD